MREFDASMSADAAVTAESCEGQRPSLLLHAAEVAPGGNRRRTAARLVAACALLLLVVVCGDIMRPQATSTDFAQKNLAPCLAHLFGTDWMGRDMLARTVAGLSTSVWVGLAASVCSGAIALVLALVSALGGRAADAVVGWLIDLVMGGSRCSRASRSWPWCSSSIGSVLLCATWPRPTRRRRRGWLWKSDRRGMGRRRCRAIPST